MADKKDDDKGRKDGNDTGDGGTTEDDDDDDDDDTDPDEANWVRLGDIVDKAVEKRLKEWQPPKTTTSSHSPRKAVPKKPERKQGFLSGQFFSNLNPKTDEE